jgi:hypothetical protein
LSPGEPEQNSSLRELTTKIANQPKTASRRIAERALLESVDSPSGSDADPIGAALYRA